MAGYPTEAKATRKQSLTEVAANIRDAEGDVDDFGPDRATRAVLAGNDR